MFNIAIHIIPIGLIADRFQTDRFCSDRFHTDRFHTDMFCLGTYPYSCDIEGLVLVLVPNTLSLEDLYITRRGYTIHHILVSVSVQIYTIYRGFA